MIQNVIILLIYLLISATCVAFIVSFKIRNRESLAVNAMWFIVFGQLVAYIFQIYRIIDHIRSTNVEFYSIDYIITYIFVGRIPEIIGISIFFFYYYTLNYRGKK
jgi:cation transport ATPase